MPKNVQTTAQLCSFHWLVRLCSKSVKLGYGSTWTKNFQLDKLGFEEAEESDIKLPTFTGSQRKLGNSRKPSTCFINDAKAFDCVDDNNFRKLLKRWEYQTTLPVSWETCKCIKKQQLELWTQQLTGSGLRKEYNKAVHCHPVYLTYMLNTSWDMPGWMSYQLELRYVGETSITSDMQIIQL